MVSNLEFAENLVLSTGDLRTLGIETLSGAALALGFSPRGSEDELIRVLERWKRGRKMVDVDEWSIEAVCAVNTNFLSRPAFFAKEAFDEWEKKGDGVFSPISVKAALDEVFSFVRFQEVPDTTEYAEIRELSGNLSALFDRTLADDFDSFEMTSAEEKFVGKALLKLMFEAQAAQCKEVFRCILEDGPNHPKEFAKFKSDLGLG